MYKKLMIKFGSKMPGIYKKRKGSRPYRNYDRNTLNNVIDVITQKKMTLRKAAAHYKVFVMTFQTIASTYHLKDSKY